MTGPELSRLLRIHEIGGIVRHESVTTTADERAGLAARFGLIALDTLSAELDVVRGAGHIRVSGILRAGGTQPCVISAEPVPFDINEAVDLRYSDGAPVSDDEIELAENDLDDLPLEGDRLDIGEAVAQSLGLALDPYPRAPEDVRAAAAKYLITEAEAEARAAAEKAAANPFGVLRK
jgi:uncharacterized metal-binding protein YceD (DUF177 family)